MPAVITECVFVDNIQDAAQTDTDAECKAFGEAIAKGVLKTLGVTENKNKVVKPVESKKPAAEVKPTTKSEYLVKVTASALNIRSGAGTNYKVIGVIRDRGTYTIVETKGNWGKLKSGAGWICLDFTKKV